MSEPKKIYSAMREVMKDIAAVGIGKDSRNTMQGFNFRGIDAAMNALSPLMVKHGIICVPRHGQADVRSRETQKAEKITYNTIVFCHSEFDLVSVEDGSSVTIRTNGEGMDTADKATNKAMSMAFKYALLQAFVIPTMAVDTDFDEGPKETIQEMRERIKRAVASASTVDELRQAKKDGQDALKAFGDQESWKPFHDDVANRLKLIQPQQDA